MTTLSIAGLMGFTTVVPAYADTTTAETVVISDGSTVQTQHLAATVSADTSLHRETGNTAASAVTTTETTTEEAAQSDTTTETTTNKTDTTTATSKSTTTSTTTDDTTAASTSTTVASSSKVQAFIAAAYAQLGAYQDCTALVERALRAIGYTVGDLGPLGFSSYGTVVSASEAQAGDIMMRSGHVEIYLGNGMAITSGYAGYQTVVYSDSPYNYSLIVRLTD